MRLVNGQKRDRHGSGLYRVNACFDAGSCAKNPAISAISKTEFPLLESGLRTVRSIFVKVRWGYTPTVLFLLFHCVFGRSFCVVAGCLVFSTGVFGCFCFFLRIRFCRGLCLGALRRVILAG